VNPTHTTGCKCFVVPPDLIARVGAHGDAQERETATRTLAESAALIERRGLATSLLRQLNVGIADLGFLAPPKGENRTVYDAEGGTDLPGTRRRGEGDAVSGDAAVDQAYDGASLTDHFYREIFERDSIDGQGIEIVSSVHYGEAFDNALWNGTQMIYGDGSGTIMARGSLTRAIDVIGHELTHGVTQATAGLHYRHQSGALNESFSDVFGSLIKQYGRNQTAEEADWLIGEGILGTALHGQALRSLKAPGHAFDFDRQPSHMSGYVNLPADNDPRNDNGGVHINSGIPNRAFYLIATTLGGYAWEKAGRIWYMTLTGTIQPDADFGAAAAATVEVAGDLFGSGSLEQRAVRAAWQVVGVLPPGSAAGMATRSRAASAKGRATKRRGATATAPSQE
jgi:Zn-dependent metalloprotease